MLFVAPGVRNFFDAVGFRVGGGDQHYTKDFPVGNFRHGPQRGISFPYPLDCRVFSDPLPVTVRFSRSKFENRTDFLILFPQSNGFENDNIKILNLTSHAPKSLG